MKESARSEQAEILSTLVDEKDFNTKTRWKNAHAQAVFMMLGFDMLSDSEKQRMLKHAYDRPADVPISIGDYFFAMNYFDAITAISEGGKSREEFVAAMGASARAEEAKTTRMLKGLFGGA